MIDRFVPEWFATKAGREDLALVLTLAAALAAIAAAIPAVALFIRWWRGLVKRAWYTPSLTFDVTRERERAGVIALGDSELRVFVQPPRATRFGSVDVRCTEINWWSFGLSRKAVSPEVIEVRQVRNHFVETGAVDLKTTTRCDGKGGLYLDHRPVYHCPKGEGLPLIINIRAGKEWCGYLGIRNMFGDDERLFVHLPLRVFATKP